MSQVVSAVTSSTKAKRSYRKGSPRSAVEGEPAEFGKNRTLRFSGHP
ncbi:RepB family protein [Klebsiella quasipneumoniae]|nr:RepB family protein [Klebsiella quasipneumoniae]MDV0854787.1 RepB family protein [Klebsiella quasipneumoniae subsp. similipneumoniae]